MKPNQIDKCWVASKANSPDLAIPAMHGGPDGPGSTCLATANPKYIDDLIEVTGMLSLHNGLSMEILEFGGRVLVLEIDGRSDCYHGNYVLNVPREIILTALVFLRDGCEDLGRVFTEGTWQPMLSEPSPHNLAECIAGDTDILLKTCRERRVIGRLIGFTTRKVRAGFEAKPKPDFN